MQYLIVRNIIISKLGRALTEIEKHHIKNCLIHSSDAIQNVREESDRGLNTDKLALANGTSPQFHQFMLQAVDEQGMQYLAIRNMLKMKLTRALTEAEKQYIKRYLGNLKDQNP